MPDIVFHRAARLEAVRASVYLEAARPRYGEKFDEELVDLCARITEHPNSGSLLDGHAPKCNVRAYRMRTFRYSLIVATLDDKLLVVAVAHHHRKPGYWNKRLK